MSVQLIVCQFCHSRQPNAWDCAVCGRPLHERPTSKGLETPALPDLEPTLQERGGEVGAVRVDGLETTSVVGEEGIGGVASNVAIPPLEGWEPTLVDDVPLAVPASDPELVLEFTELADPEPPTARGALVCRYCATPGRSDGSRFCPRCGMRIR